MWKAMIFQGTTQAAGGALSAGENRIRENDPVIERTLLEAVPAFAGVDEHVVAAIARVSDLREAVRDEVILDQGGRPEHLHVLLSGQVGLTARSPDGRTTVVEVVKPVELFFAVA